MKKRIFASLLALIMAFSLLPASALAATMSWEWTVTVIGGKYYRADGTETSTNKYTINRHLDNSVNHEIGYKFEWNARAGGNTYNGGWQLCLTVDGSVVERSTAYIYTRDMSNASGSWTAPSSSHTGTSRHPFTIYLSNYPGMTPNLSITKTVDKTKANVGDELTYTITVKNARGAAAASNVVVEDTLPNGLEFINSNPSPTSQNGQKLTWTISSIADGGSATITLKVKASEAGTYANTATISGTNKSGTTGDVEVVENEPAGPTKPTRDDFDADTNANKILIVCDDKPDKTHDEALPYNAGTYTIAWTEGSDSCTLTFDVASYVAVYNANTQRPAHTAVANQTVTQTCTYRSGKWNVDDTERPEIHVTCEPVVDPSVPDRAKIPAAIGNTLVLVQCETKPNDHQTIEARISAVDSELTGIKYTQKDTTVSVEITNPEAYAAAYKPGDVTHTYKAEGSRLTFTLTWGKDDTTGEWDYHLTGESPLINTVCEITPEKYTVHYDLKGGKGASGVSYDDVTVSAGDKITVLAAPTRSGYTFKGWKAGNTTYQPGDKLTVNGAITFTAQWSKDSSHDDDDYDYTLRYVTNGGKAISSESKSRSWVKDYEDLPVPTRVGYRFNGWYYDTKLTKAVTGDVQVSSRTVTLYAGWTENSVPAILNGDDHFAYIQGYDDGTVRPNTPVTRAQVATILFRLLDEDVRDKYLTETNTFTDVAADYWANTAISTMANLGVFKGRTADRFDPNAPITRGEFAAVCARFDDSSVQSSNAFSDIDGYWAKQEILRAAALGWVQGYQDGTFRPTASITRAQVVTMINRVLCRQPETASDLLRGMTTFTDCAEGDWCYLAIQEAANSHDYVGKSGSIYESWTDLNKSADWSKYEH